MIAFQIQDTDINKCFEGEDPETCRNPQLGEAAVQSLSFLHRDRFTRDNSDGGDGGESVLSS